MYTVPTVAHQVDLQYAMDYASFVSQCLSCIQSRVAPSYSLHGDVAALVEASNAAAATEKECQSKH